MKHDASNAALIKKTKRINPALAVPVLAGCILILAAGCSRKSASQLPAEKIREYANALYNRDLYQEAIEEYQHYLDYYPVKAQERASINFTIADIYFERLHDYQKALAGYLRVKHLFPESDLREKADKQIVACMERLGRSADAKQALDEATRLNQPEGEENRPGEVLARVGQKEITSGDLDFRIKQLPESIQKDISGREARLQFLQQLVATELFYEAAKRQGLDQDKEVIAGAFEAKKSLMVQKYLAAQISQSMNVTPDDVKLYYQAHKDRYVVKDGAEKSRQKSFQEAAEEAAQDLTRERQQKAYSDLLQRMIKSEDVQIYDDKVK